MNFVALTVMTMLGAAAGFYLKKASGSLEIPSLLKNPSLYVGGTLYLISAVLNIYLLKVLPYSVVLPLTAVTYIWTMILSHFFLKERISKKKIAGVCLILAGAVLIAL